MSTENQNSILENEELEDEELDIDNLEASLVAELEVQFADLAFLEDEKEKISNPDSLIKVIRDEVITQFGNQIGLDMTNETLIQAYTREHPEEYSKEIGDAIMQDEKYKQANAAMKKQHEEGNLTDTYTGKKLTESDKPNLDHVVSRKELFDNIRRKQAHIETKDLANKKENLAPTNESLNKSKKDKSVEKYVEQRSEREKTLKKQNEKKHEKIDASNMSEAEKKAAHEKEDKRLQDKLNANDELMLSADKDARKAINHDIVLGVAKQTTKKAGKDALKMMVVSALFDLLKSIMNGLIRSFKEKQKSFKLFLAEMRDSIKNFINHISSIIRTGASSFIGTVVSEIFGPIVSMFKKLASFIKQGVSTLTEAVHYLTSKESKGKPLSIKIAQVGKIVTTGLTAAGAIVGGELIEKALLNIPIMSVEIPLLGSIANITGMFLASLLSGVIGAIVINWLNKFIAKNQTNDNLSAQINKKNDILQTQDRLIDIKIQKLSNLKNDAAQRMTERRQLAVEAINESLSAILYEDKDNHTSDTLAAIENNLEELLN